MVESAGLLIIHNNKMVLAHPSQKSLKIGTYTIPKGKLEIGETHIEAAIRETKEEVGIDIDLNLIDTTPHIINYYNERGSIYKKLTYFIVNLENEIPINNDTLDRSEIDWAGYLDKDDATLRIFWRFGEMLGYLKDQKK